MCGPDLIVFGVDEGAHDQPGVAKSRDCPTQAALASLYIEAAFCRDFLSSLGDEHDHLRPKVNGDGDHLIRCRHLKIQLDVCQFGEPANIVILNVPAVFAQMNRDAVSAAKVRTGRRPNRVGLVGSPGLAYCGNMVDVHAEFDHARRVRAGVAFGKRSCAGCAALTPGNESWIYCNIQVSFPMSQFQHKLAQLKNDLITQGDRVVEHTLKAVEAYFESDPAKAAQVIEGDSVIDRVDVEIERASIPLLAMGETAEHSIRSVLTIVKINNELERIADLAVNIAEAVVVGDSSQSPPPTFRVMANSVIGMLRDANRALANDDVELGERVLRFDDTVNQFKREIMLDAQQKVATGSFPVDFAFRLLTVTKSLERIADHCTNICEQVIYLESGNIVRHLPEGWTKPLPPEAL
jgi:phosphate transport system protein